MMPAQLSLPLALLLALASCPASDAVAPITSGSIFRMTASVSPVPVNVDESADLTCQLESAGIQRDTYSVYWHSRVTDVAENCIPYNKEKYEMICNDPNPKLATAYTLRIKKVQWADRGMWDCKFVTNVSSVFLDVNRPASLASFVASQGPPSAATTQPKADGTAASPYDLTGGGGLNFTCRSSCGYPASRLQLDYQGVNVQLQAAPRDAFRVVATQDNSSCQDPGYQLLSTTEVAATLPNCSALQLDGMARFRCSGERPGLYKDIYVYCPVIARDYPLTQGEIAAASVGAVLGVFLIILGFVLFCQRKSTEDMDDSAASQPMQV